MSQNRETAPLICGRFEGGFGDLFKPGGGLEYIDDLSTCSR